MTQEQAKRLCELEPSHFRMPGMYLWFNPFEEEKHHPHEVISFGIGNRRDYANNQGAMLWWMVTRMPDVVLCAPIMSGNWSCDDSRLERYGASGDTPEEAVISAYIKWLESRQTK